MSEKQYEAVFEFTPVPQVLIWCEAEKNSVRIVAAKTNTAARSYFGQEQMDDGIPLLKRISFSGSELNRILHQVLAARKKLISMATFKLNNYPDREMLCTFVPVNNSMVLMAIDQDAGRIFDDSKTSEEKKGLIEQIRKKTTQYESASRELDDFVYSVSHDLRAPLRRLDGFSQELINEYTEQLDDTGVHYLNRIRKSAQDMGHLIDDLLKLSRISRSTLEREDIDIGNLVKEAFQELIDDNKVQNVQLKIEGDLSANADPGLIRILLSNLISNALKFSSAEKQPVIEAGSVWIDDIKAFYIKDNGVGFDPAYSDKLYQAFQRLHSQHEFPGTGIGLATVKRIVNLHGGEVWAESTPGKGATFYYNFK